MICADDRVTSIAAVHCQGLLQGETCEAVVVEVVVVAQVGGACDCIKGARCVFADAHAITLDESVLRRAPKHS